MLDDNSFLDSREAPESHEPVGLTFGNNPVNQRRFSCLTCDEPDCAQIKVCFDAITVIYLFYYINIYIQKKDKYFY